MLYIAVYKCIILIKCLNLELRDWCIHYYVNTYTYEHLYTFVSMFNSFTSVQKSVIHSYWGFLFAFEFVPFPFLNQNRIAAI